MEIKTMPEQFYFKKVKIPKEGRGGGKKPTLIIAMVIIVVVLMSGVAYLFLQSLTSKPTVSPPSGNVNEGVNALTNVAPVNAPVNAPANVPPSPICGNGVCESGEDSVTCVADCPAPAPPAELSPYPLLRAADTDKDGLTDVEESLYGTNLTNPDTDSDGYSDGLEVVNLYNPAGLAPQKIEETALVKIYANQPYNYSIFYPSLWSARALDETQREIMFTSSTGEIMQVIVDDNLEQMSLRDWYLAEVSGASGTEFDSAVTKSGLSGIKSLDGLTVYFSSGDKIYAINYSVGVKTELNYESTLEMMIKSFKISI